MLKKILIALAAIAVVFVGYVAMQPSEFRVVRTATVAAPTPDVFAQVNNFHNWEAWSPWAKLDPAAKATFGGPPAGPGAVFTWAGNDKVGEGRMTLKESRPSDLIRIKLEFLRPFKATNTAEFTFKPDGIIVIPVGPPGAQRILKVVKEAAAGGQIAVKRSDIYNGRPVPFVPFTKLDGEAIKGTH